MSTPRVATDVVFLRLPPDELARIDEAIARVEKETGMSISRAKAIRALVAAGLGGPRTMLTVKR